MKLNDQMHLNLKRGIGNCWTRGANRWKLVFETLYIIFIYISIDYLKIRIKSQHSFLSTCTFIKYVNLSAYRPLYTNLYKNKPWILARKPKVSSFFWLGTGVKFVVAWQKGKNSFKNKAGIIRLKVMVVVYPWERRWPTIRYSLKRY